MQKNATLLWKLIVDVAKPGEQLAFVENIVMDLAVLFQHTGALPECREVRIADDEGAFINFSIHPIGNIGEWLVKLSELLADPRHRDSFHVGAANFVDVQREDVSAGRIVPPKPGLLLSANGMPALIIGGEPERLVLRMEGFERAVIGLTADVPDLWENVRRAEGWLTGMSSEGRKIVGPKTKKAIQKEGYVQRESARQKRSFRRSAAGLLRLVLPAMTIRPIEVSGDAVANLGGGAVMVPVRGQKVHSGAYPTRPPVEILREALGVQTVIADVSLRVLLDDTTQVEQHLEPVLPRSNDHLHDIGWEHLSQWTGFDRDRDIEVWAAAKYSGVARTRRVEGMAAEIEAALVPIKILSRAFLHAERIAAAYDLTEGVDDESAREIIELAYEDSPHSELEANDLFDIAVYGDINPSMLWTVHNEAIVEILEAARVLGRVRAGAKTAMSPPVQRVLYEGLFGIVLPHNDRDETLIALRHRAAAGFAKLLGTDKLGHTLEAVEDSREYILVERKTRKMKAISPNTAQKVAVWRKK